MLNIIKSNKDSLIIQTSRSLLDTMVFLIFLMFISGVGLFFLIFPSRSRINCQRIEPTFVNCQTVQVGWLPLITTAEKSFRQVERASLKTKTIRTDDGSYTTSKVWIKTANGEFPINKFKGANSLLFWTPGYKFVREVNKFLETPQVVDFEHHTRGLKFLFWGMLITPFFGTLFLVLLFFDDYQIIWHFDRSSQTLTRIGKTIFYKNRKNYRLEQIHSVLIEIYEYHWDDFTIKLELKTEDKLKLVAFSLRMSISSFGWEKLKTIIEEITNLVGCSNQLVYNGFRFNRQSGELIQTLTSYGAQKTYPLSEIQDIVASLTEYPEEKDSDMDTKYPYTYQVNVILSGGYSILLQEFSSYQFIKTPHHAHKAKKKAKALVTNIKTYLED